MKKLLIVGAGGVGSWLAWFLNDYEKSGQLPEMLTTVADPDTVDLKNLNYQKFDKTDLTDNKAAALHAKYGFNFIPKAISTEEELNGYDCIVCAVDNTVFRKMFFNYVFNINPNVYWIDMRSEGRTIAFFTKHQKNTYEYMIDTLPKEEVLEGSCQLAYELDAGIIQGGNRIVASIGSQLLLNWYREDHNSSRLIHRF